MRMRSGQPFIAPQKLSLGGIQARIVARIVPKPAIEKKRPDESDGSEQLESLAPVHQLEDDKDQRGCKRTTPAGTEPHDPLCPDPLFLRQPRRERFGEVGKTAR